MPLNGDCHSLPIIIDSRGLAFESVLQISSTIPNERSSNFSTLQIRNDLPQWISMTSFPTLNGDVVSNFFMTDLNSLSSAFIDSLRSFISSKRTLRPISVLGFLASVVSAKRSTWWLMWSNSRLTSDDLFRSNWEILRFKRRTSLMWRRSNAMRLSWCPEPPVNLAISSLNTWIEAPISSGAWVRIPLQSPVEWPFGEALLIKDAW